MSRLVRVETTDFCVASEYQAGLARVEAQQPGACGAVASFVGLVRDYFGDEKVNELFLEHYPGMTERSIESLIERAEQRWALLDTVVIHRVGALTPAEQIVFVQVASSHRPDAFAACEFIMDYLKTDAVFWKRESHGSGAQRWVESTAGDRQRAEAWTLPEDGDKVSKDAGPEGV